MRVPVAIVDYGMGNLGSVAKAFRALGAEPRLITTAAEVETAPVLVLPGVGAFPDAMAHLERSGLVAALQAASARGAAFLGICLGMQMLFERSYEKGDSPGLGLLPGTVARLPVSGLKVPHMGWNQVDARQDHPLLAGIPAGAHVYFVHSYVARPTDSGTVIATTDYGIEFPCIVGRGRTLGIQFHPEKSQAVGLKMIANFLSLADASCS